MGGTYVGNGSNSLCPSAWNRRGGKSGAGLDGAGSRKSGDSWLLLSRVEAHAAPEAILINQTVERGVIVLIRSKL